MNISCKVIQDLLPLYHDGVCSPESSAMIEEHLKDCEACQEEFHKLEESPLAKNGKKEEAEKENVQRIKNVKKVLKKKRVRVSVITAVVVLLLCIPGWFVMNLRFLAAKPSVLETVSVDGDILTVSLKDSDSIWGCFLFMDTGYLEENGQQIPVAVLSSSASPSQYLSTALSPQKGSGLFRNFSMTDLYKLLFLSSGAYYQASDELGYQPGTYPDEFAMQEVQERAQEILADWEPTPGEGFQRVYFYDGSMVKDLYNLSISWEEMVENLDSHGTLLWTAEDGVVYNP